MQRVRLPSLPARQVRPRELTLTIRTTRSTVSFSNPFTLQNLKGIQPAGEYVILIDDELIEGLSRVAYQRLVTLIQTSAISAPKRKAELVSVSQTSLDAALMKDHQMVVMR